MNALATVETASFRILCMSALLRRMRLIVAMSGVIATN
jgi:hypothetical protein